jgi:Leucine-rich repeat (LRR) protein
MKAGKLWLVWLLQLIIVSVAYTQQKTPDTKAHEQKVRDMVAFLEYVLNTIGSGETAARDKDVLITESYTKIFRDAKVQVEDDLVEKRNVITNKDVQAYLKDVDFFFKDVKFEFTIKEIKGSVNANDKLFYNVSLLRNIKGTTADGVAVSNTIPRFVEINYDTKEQDLKIVSIYTNEFDEKEALQNWWKSLSYEWQSAFRRKMNIVSDSVKLGDIKNIVSIETLDLGNNQYIQSIEPLGQLINLRELNLSGTSLKDLSPIRNLTDLSSLDISGTKVSDISHLKYSEKITRLNLSRTLVSDISVVANMNLLEQLSIRQTAVIDFSHLAELPKLKTLDLGQSQIIDLSPLSGLTALENLNVSQTPVNLLAPLQGLTSIQVLNLDSTRLSEITSLSALKNLRVVHLNYTAVANLRPLQELKHLERIYCDHTPIKQTLANAFMSANPGVLVIYDSEDLRGWWQQLQDPWREVLASAAGVQPDPTKEDLARVTNLDSINIANNQSIMDLRPLQHLQKLRVILAAGTSIRDLYPLQEHKSIEFLDVSDTKVSSLTMISQLSKLRVFRAERTAINDLNGLSAIISLEKVFVDGTTVDKAIVQDFLTRRTNCLVVFESAALETWWTNLPNEWKDIFGTQVPIREKSFKEDVHRLVELEEVHFRDVSVSNLTALEEFIRLKVLRFSGTAVSDLEALERLNTLTTLHATNSPIRDIGSLRTLSLLEDLDISNTPVESLAPLNNLQYLQVLNCSGTQIKSVEDLEYLPMLENLDCSNTSVKKIGDLTSLPLKTLKCYNTRLSSRTVDRFKEARPDCNVVYY